MPLLWILPCVLAGSMVLQQDEQEIKFADCPAAVRKAFQAEAKGSKIEVVTKETDDEDETVYWADVLIGGKSYAVGILEDGTLTEMNLAVGDKELPLDKCPEAVRATIRAEAFGAKIDMVSIDRKYGGLIYEVVAEHKGRSYEIVVGEEGTLVEKVLVIEDEETELAGCPAAVRATLHTQAKDGTIGDITRSTGVGKPVYEAEIEIKRRVYLIEVDETGLLISKSLHASEE